MKKQICYKAFLIPVCLLFANLSFAQKLNLTDILTVYQLDSLSLKDFSSKRQFNLIKVKEDNWIFSYTYQSAIDTAISFIRTFPKDQSDKIFLYYYFVDRKDYRNFKDSLGAKGFKKIRTFVSHPNTSVSDYREGYGTDKLELELSTPEVKTRKRTLLLYKRVNFRKSFK